MNLPWRVVFLSLVSSTDHPTALDETLPFHLPWQYPGQFSSAGAAALLLAALRAHRELLRKDCWQSRLSADRESVWF